MPEGQDKDYLYHKISVRRLFSHYHQKIHLSMISGRSWDREGALSVCSPTDQISFVAGSKRGPIVFWEYALALL